jgi:hypothetical protein
MAKAKKKKSAREGKDHIDEVISLEQFVARITAENRYPETPFGAACGKEIIKDSWS